MAGCRAGLEVSAVNLKFFIPLIFIFLGLGFVAYNVFLASQTIPEIVYGQDKCDNCGMIISEKKYSAIAYSIGEERWVKFDDLGGLFMYMVKHGGREKFRDIYVFDFNTGERISALDAYFVKGHPDKVWTPMSSGIVAFKSLSDAESYASQVDGMVMSFQELYTWVYNNPDMVFQGMDMKMKM